MRFTPAPLDGLWILDPTPHGDRRGSFARLFAAEEFRARGLESDLVHINQAENTDVNIVRGLHFQTAPHEEAKVVRCFRGAVFDVVVDVRPESPTLHRWFALELSAENGRQLYIPPGFAHGYQVLERDSALTYFVTAAHAPDSEAGLRWDDPALGIEWPLTSAPLLSAKDREWPLIGSADYFAPGVGACDSDRASAASRPPAAATGVGA